MRSPSWPHKFQEKTPKRPHQLNDEDEVVELLPHQHGMEVVQQDFQVLLAVSVGHDNGHPVTGSTVGGVVVTPGLQAWVQPHDLRQVGGVFVGRQGAHWNEEFTVTVSSS